LEVDIMNTVVTDMPAVVSDDTEARRHGQFPAFDSVSLRDYFAAAALQGILSSHSGEVSLPDDAKAAKWSYQAADAMLAARLKTPA
jgi:hypothetical protein